MISHIKIFIRKLNSEQNSPQAASETVFRGLLEVWGA